MDFWPRSAGDFGGRGLRFWGVGLLEFSSFAGAWPSVGGGFRDFLAACWELGARLPMRRFPVHPGPSKGTCTPVRTSTSRPCMRWRATGMPVWTTYCPCWTLCPSTWTYQLCMQRLGPPCCMSWLSETISQPCSTCWTSGPKLPNLRWIGAAPCYMRLHDGAAWKCCSSWCSDGRRASDKQTDGAGGLCSSQLKMGAWKPCACCGRRGRSHRRLSDLLIPISMGPWKILIAAR